MTEKIDADVSVIRQNIKTSEALGHLAEEACELAQAVLKIQRLRTENNKPRKTAEECFADLYEEIADVMLCLGVLGLDDRRDFEALMLEKSGRWAGSLNHGPV